MSKKLIWGIGIGLVVVSALVLFNTEASYLRFIGSLEAVTTTVNWLDTVEGDEKLTLVFGVEFENLSTLPMWVEAINTGLYFDDEFVGLFTISEGRNEVPAGQTLSVELRVPFFEVRQQQFADAIDNGADMYLTGKARVRFGADHENLKTFYNVEGIFPLGATDGG